MIFKKNKNLKRLLALIILASCSTTSKNLNLNSIELLKEDNPKDFLEIYEYQSYFDNDLGTIQAAIGQACPIAACIVPRSLSK